VSQVTDRSLGSCIDNALSLTSRYKVRGRRNRIKVSLRARLEVEALESRLVPSAVASAVLTLGTDGNLWLETPGVGRTWVDGNVHSFAHGSDGYDYVLGTNGALWKELPGWQTNGRTWVDGNVQSFALGNYGYDYVLGTNGALWKELPGWQSAGRTWVDGNVQTFSLGSDGYDYVLGTNGALWKELPGWQTNGRTWVDGSVQSFAHGSDGYDYVLGTDGALWKELPGWQTNGRTWVDGNAQGFALGGDGYDYVLSKDGTVWQELPGWQTNGRTAVDPNALGFAQGSGGYNYVLGTTTGNVTSYMLNPSFTTTGIQNNLVVVVPNPVANPQASAAYAPAPFDPNHPSAWGAGGPSYQDVQQGFEGDCWLMASLAEVAARAPLDIEHMIDYRGAIRENGSWVGVYTVRLYGNPGSAQYVTVDTELPGGGTYYDHPVNGVLWAALAEKAYVVANGNSYDALNSGDAQNAIMAITGKDTNTDGYHLGDLSNVWQNEGNLVVLGTQEVTGPLQPINGVNIVPNHAYAVVGYNSSTQQFQLFNPWGVNGGYDRDNRFYPGTVWATEQQLTEDFETKSYGAGAAPGGREGRLALSPQELADMVFIENLLDARSKHRSGSSAVFLHGVAGV
jgi:hypothetical protein